MTRRATLAAVFALAVCAPPAAAETTTISTPGKYFDPPRATMVAGDEVVFRNDDLVTHDVRIGGGVFDSGPILRFAGWSQRIDQPGPYPFVCTLHAFMSGNLDVVAATLAAASDAVLAGEPLRLSGRAPVGTPQLAVERSLQGGEWLATGVAATPASDGTFTATVPAAEGASYRVATPAGPSEVVTPRVTARIDVHVAVSRTRGRTTVHAHAMPAPKGFVATLELYARWRYRWRAHQTARLDSHGAASFRVPRSYRTRARIALRRKTGGPALVHSGVVSLRSGRQARDPNTIVPPLPGGSGHGGPHSGGESDR
jgi:plastocyanin